MSAHGKLIQTIPYKALAALAALGLSAQMASAACAPLPVLWPALDPLIERVGNAGTALASTLKSPPPDELEVTRAMMVTYEVNSALDAMIHLGTPILLYVDMESEADGIAIVRVFEQSLPTYIEQLNRGVRHANLYISRMRTDAFVKKSFDARDAMIEALDLLEKHCAK